MNYFFSLQGHPGVSHNSHHKIVRSRSHMPTGTGAEYIWAIPQPQGLDNHHQHGQVSSHPAGMNVASKNAGPEIQK